MEGTCDRGCSRRDTRGDTQKPWPLTTSLRFDQIRLPEECETLRREVRAFLAEEIAAGTFSPDRTIHTETFSREFSRKVGAKGWIGMTWPKKYGGRERSFLERYVVTEEFRVANAPVRLHFVADRQSGPILSSSHPSASRPTSCRASAAARCASPSA